MPGHIYSRLKRYEDAVFQQEASARVDHAHMMRDRVLPDQIHNFAHNNEWLTRSLRHHGRVREAVGRLPEKQRATLILKVYHELTHQEVAQVLGSTVGTVKANLFHALANLVQGRNNVFQAGPLAAQCLGVLRIVPDIRIFQLAVYFFQTLFTGSVVKDTP